MNLKTQTTLENNVHYWIGRLQEAERWVDIYRKFKSAPMKKLFKEAEAARREALHKVIELSR